MTLSYNVDDNVDEGRLMRQRTSYDTDTRRNIISSANRKILYNSSRGYLSRLKTPKVSTLLINNYLKGNLFLERKHKLPRLNACQLKARDMR